MEGWVKFHREWINNPYIAKDGEHLAIWMYLMLNATHTEMQAQFGKEIITLKSGQLLTSYREIEERLKINRCKVNRVFEWLKKGTLIETAIGSTKTLVTISVWQDSQAIGETQNETEVRHNRDTKQDREKEKEKRSKREKEKEKEKNKNERMKEVCVCACDTHENIISLGRYENIFVDKGWLDSFKDKYWYYDKVIDKLSAYKQAQGIHNIDDRPYPLSSVP